MAARPRVDQLRHAFGANPAIASHLEWSRLRMQIAQEIGPCDEPDCRCEWEVADTVLAHVMAFLTPVLQHAIAG